MKLRGLELKLETRRCMKCPRSFRVLFKSKQVFCSNFCKAIADGTLNVYKWGAESAHVVKPPRRIIKP